VAFGPERTIEQDSMFAFRIVVDIAIKVRIPTQGGQVFRSDPGHCSDLMAATIPI